MQQRNSLPPMKTSKQGGRTATEVIIPPLPSKIVGDGGPVVKASSPVPAVEPIRSGNGSGVNTILQTAEGYERTRDFSRAVVLYRTAVKRAYETAEGRLKVEDWEGAAAAFVEAREYMLKLIKCTEVGRIKPDPDAERWRTYYLERAAECKAKTGNLADSAEMWIRACIERRDLGDFGESARAHIEAANCFMLMAKNLQERKGTDPKEVVMSIRKAADQTVHAAECTMKVGQRRYDEGDWDQTILEYRNAAQLFSNASEQYGHIGMMKAQLANIAKSDECISAAQGLQEWVDAQK